MQGEKATITHYQICYPTVSPFAYQLYLVNSSLCFSSQSGRFPLMLAAHPGVIKTLHQAAATEQVRYRLLHVRCYCTRSLLQWRVVRMYMQLMYTHLHS